MPNQNYTYFSCTGDSASQCCVCNEQRCSDMLGLPRSSKTKKMVCNHSGHDLAGSSCHLAKLCRFFEIFQDATLLWGNDDVRKNRGDFVHRTIAGRSPDSAAQGRPSQHFRKLWGSTPPACQNVATPFFQSRSLSPQKQ